MIIFILLFGNEALLPRRSIEWLELVHVVQHVQLLVRVLSRSVNERLPTLSVAQLLTILRLC